MKVDTVADGFVFPESLRLHGDELWFTDLFGERILRLNSDGTHQVVLDTTTHFVGGDNKPSGIGFLPDDSLLIVETAGKRIWRFHDGELSVHADLSKFPGNYLNDMIVDSVGRAYVGSRFWPPASGCLVLVNRDGSSEMAADNFLSPNGMAITEDGTSFIVAETHGHRIWAFERDANGRLIHRRVFAELQPDQFPDGICVDAEGAVWTATGYGRTCLRVLEGGHVAETVKTDENRWIITCVLGGADRRSLFMSTVETEVENLETLNSPESETQSDHHSWARSLSRGWIEKIDVVVPGVGNP